MKHITVVVPRSELFDLLDGEIVAYVKTWNMEPKGYPMNHRLYYYDSEKEWSYLTAAGHAVEPCPTMLENEEKLCLQWSKGAVNALLEETCTKGADAIPPSIRQLHLAHDEALSAARWCARHGFTGDWGSRLPNLLSTRATEYIEADVYRFMDMVKRERTKQRALGGN